MRDYYGILELGKTASGDEIKTNYRRLAMKWHPDRNPLSAEAEERFKLISEAYATLSDPIKRREYDASVASGAHADASFARGRAAGPDFSGFSAERAASMFMNEMLNLAGELTMQNVGWRDIARELTRRGCPAEVAAEIARKIEKRRKTMIRGNAGPYFVRSAVSGFFGLVLVALFGGMGLGLIGFFGLMMVVNGAYNLLRALYFMTTGNAPRSSLL